MKLLQQKLRTIQILSKINLKRHYILWTNLLNNKNV